MSGIVYMILGAVLLAGSTVGIIVLEIFLLKKKRRIREEVYQIYD